VTKDEVIDVLARLCREAPFGVENQTPWELLPEQTRQVWREAVACQQWPLMVDFVAEWMQNWYGAGAPPMSMPREWHEEMGA
jgi:hypothetical protein